MPLDGSQDTAEGLGTFTVVSWNLYHGRDAPPDPALHSWRSRLLGETEDNGTYLQVNRSLQREFADVIAAGRWSVCLLQEAPPSWARGLAARCRAQAFRCLTSRNQFRPVTSLLARRNPDLIGSWEGGSNLTMVRGPWRLVESERRSLLLNPLRERGLHERRRMSFVRLRSWGADAGELCVANLHASHYSRSQAEREGRRAARAALAWAGGTPLVLGGDFNVRPQSSSLFAEVERDFGLAPATASGAIDHLLVRGANVLCPPARCPARELEIAWNAGRRTIRLSDHAPVQVRLSLSRAGMRY